MTLTSNSSDTRSNHDEVFSRCYATQIPRWQKYQSTLLSPSISTSTKTSKVGGGENDIPHQYMRQYSHVYHQRLSMLGPKCWNSIENDDTIHLVSGSRFETSSDEANDCEMSSNDPTTNRDNTVVRVDRVLELKENVRSVIVGTLVKESTMSSIIDGEEKSKNESKSHEDQIHPQSTCFKTDQLYLEDESGRVALEFTEMNEEINSMSMSFSSSKHQYSSGIVVGLLGVVSLDGTMTIEKMYQPMWDSPTTSIISNSVVNSTNTIRSDNVNGNQRDSHLLFISGLDCGHQEKSSLPREMLLSFLQGSLGAIDKAIQISHIICCGGLIAPPSSEKKLYSNDLSLDMISSTMNGCRDLDSFCYQIIYETGIPLTILPGKDDPTTANWPQRPLHKSFLPVSIRSITNVKKILSIVPNPFAALYQSTCNYQNDNDSFEQKEVQQYVVGTDGTNVQDLVKRLLVPVIQEDQNLEEKNETERKTAGNDTGDVDMLNDDDGDDTLHSSAPVTSHTSAAVSYEPISELDALEYSLRWGHICPTGPETVPTIPHSPENPDPMVLQESLPSIYFAGNCSKFGTRLIDMSASYSKHQEQQQQTRLICIPKFSNTGEAVTVNLRTLQVELLRFQE